MKLDPFISLVSCDFYRNQSETDTAFVPQVVREDAAEERPPVESACKPYIMNPGHYDAVSSVTQTVVTATGLELIADLEPVNHCEESVITIRPVNKNMRLAVNSGDVEASIGLWVFLHTFQETVHNRGCDATSFQGQQGCAVKTIPLKLKYDASTQSFTASFVADWAVKYYKFSLEVRSCAFP